MEKKNLIDFIVRFIPSVIDSSYRFGSIVQDVQSTFQTFDLRNKTIILNYALNLIIRLIQVITITTKKKISFKLIQTKVRRIRYDIYIGVEYKLNAFFRFSSY